jgi:hypothetical protein
VPKWPVAACEGKVVAANSLWKVSLTVMAMTDYCATLSLKLFIISSSLCYVRQSCGVRACVCGEVLNRAVSPKQASKQSISIINNILQALS